MNTYNETSSNNKCKAFIELMVDLDPNISWNSSHQQQQ